VCCALIGLFSFAWEEEEEQGAEVYINTHILRDIARIGDGDQLQL
jgi:hypothetical protein